MLFVAEWTGEINKWSALIASVVDMRPSLSVHSSSIWTGGVTDHITTAKLEDVAWDSSPDSSEQSNEQGLGVEVVL